MGDISPNFSRWEFDLPEAKAKEYGFSAQQYPEEWIPTRLVPLCRALEVVRSRFNTTITVISGFRPKEYDLRRIAAGNRGVSPDSQHHDGRAADFRVKGISPERVRQVVEELYHVGAIEIGGLGTYPDFTHLDVRGGPFHRWHWPPKE